MKEKLQKNIPRIFKRQCRRCDKMYQPVGKFQDYCEECQKKAREECNERQRRKWNEKKKST